MPFDIPSLPEPRLTSVSYTHLDVYKRQIHFTDSESSVQDIVNITAVAVIDAYVEKIKKQKFGLGPGKRKSKQYNYEY